MFRSSASLLLRRLQSTLTPPAHLTPEEVRIFTKLSSELQPSHLTIQDLSGGCGQLYAIEVTSKAFNNLTMIKQHRLVNGILKEDVAKWHGLTLKTSKDL